MAGGFCRGKVAYAVESKIFFSRSDRPEISIRQKLNKEQMEIPGRPCRKECQSGHMKPITCGALCELSNNVVEKLASKYSNVEKEVTEVMGGKVLNYRSKEIYLEGCAFGREEGREEGRKEGQKESIVQLVTRKYQLGDSPEKIAKDLLMSEEEVEEILGKTTGSQQ